MTVSNSLTGSDDYIWIGPAASQILDLANRVVSTCDPLLDKYELRTFLDPGDKEDNLYVWADVSGGVPGTPVSLRAHLGYSDGNPGLGPNGTSLAPTGKYLDWLVGADLAIPGTPLTLGVAYVDTDIKRSDETYIRPNFMVQDADDLGESIARGQIVFSLTAAF